MFCINIHPHIYTKPWVYLSKCIDRVNVVVESSWNVMAYGDAREEKWRGNWQMEWVASTLHTTPEHGLYDITTADAYTSAASSRLNWRPCRFKWTRPFRRKTKSGFCASAITFQAQSRPVGWNSNCNGMEFCNPYPVAWLICLVVPCSFCRFSAPVSSSQTQRVPSC